MCELGPICCPPSLWSASPTGAVAGASVLGLGWTEGGLHGFLCGRAVCRVTVTNQMVLSRELQR